MIEVKESSVEEAALIHSRIHEFPEYTEEKFRTTISGKDELVLVAYVNGQQAGYLVAYDKFADGSYYCWMTGTCLEFRRMGVLTALYSYLENGIRSKGYGVLKIKTLNRRRGMLNFLMKNEFNITGVKEYPNIADNRILLEKKLT